MNLESITNSAPGIVTAIGSGVYLNSKISTLYNEIEQYQEKFTELLDVVKNTNATIPIINELTKTCTEQNQNHNSLNDTVETLKSKIKMQENMIKALCKTVNELAEKLNFDTIHIKYNKSNKNTKSKRKKKSRDSYSDSDD